MQTEGKGCSLTRPIAGKSGDPQGKRNGPEGNRRGATPLHKMIKENIAIAPHRTLKCFAAGGTATVSMEPFLGAQAQRRARVVNGAL